MRNERQAFYGTVALVLTIPVVAGLAGAFGGLEGLARVLMVSEPLGVPASLRNSLRAICFMFFAVVPLVAWSLASIAERAGAFRIIAGCAFLAGFARVTGWLMDGAPGVVPIGIMLVELCGMPALLLWHARLVRLARR